MMITYIDNLVIEVVVHYIRASVTGVQANSSEPLSPSQDSWWLQLYVGLWWQNLQTRIMFLTATLLFFLSNLELKIESKLEVMGPTWTGCSKLGDLSYCCKPVVFKDPLHWKCLWFSILERCNHHLSIILSILIAILIVTLNFIFSSF